MKQYVVDVFADQNFKGNQAAVCIFDSWISDELMQNIAKENNFSEARIEAYKKVLGENGIPLNKNGLPMAISGRNQRVKQLKAF